MKKHRHTPEIEIRKLAEGGKLQAQVQTLAELVRHLGITASIRPADAQSGFESRLIIGQGP